MMGNEVFIHLDCGDPGLTLVRNSGLSTDTHNEVIVMECIDELGDGVGIHPGIGVNLVNASEGEKLENKIWRTIRHASK
jgi:hypothetical protein